MARAGIALGSNLGDRADHLRKAMRKILEIATPGEEFLAAPVYQTEPRFCPPGSPEFLNTVVEIDFIGTPMELLELTRQMERHLGRIPSHERNAPRVIDIDLLYFGELVLDNDRLALPHPRMVERRFVLQPLADIRPDLILPGQTATVADLLNSLVSDEPPLERIPSLSP